MTVKMIIAPIGTSVVAYAIVSRSRLITPVLLIAADVEVTLLPAGRKVSLSSTMALAILPLVLLCWESPSISLNRMWRSLRDIILSVTVFVTITTTLIALIDVLTRLDVGAALLIGVCLGPTDTTVVSSLGCGINPNGRIVLQAESLPNDGTALIILTIALQTAHDPPGIIFGLITRQLLLSFGGGTGVGILVGVTVTKIGIRVRAIADNPMLTAITALVTPLLTFSVAKEIGGSGVLAVVICSIVISRLAVPYMSLGLRVLDIPFWTILTHILNTIFLVMAGVVPSDIVAELSRVNLVCGLILIPTIYVIMVTGRLTGQHLIICSIRALDRHPEQCLCRTNIRGCIVSMVAGSHGTISLAVALSIPTFFDDAVHAGRSPIILAVAGATLLSFLIQGLALPHVVCWANAESSASTQTAESAESQKTEALADILADAISQLNVIAERAGVDDDAAIEAVRADCARRHDSVSNANAGEKASVYGNRESVLRLAVVEHLYERVQSLRFAGHIDDPTALRVNRCFDVETLHINGSLNVEQIGFLAPGKAASDRDHVPVTAIFQGSGQK